MSKFPTMLLAGLVAVATAAADGGAKCGHLKNNTEPLTSTVITTFHGIDLDSCCDLCAGNDDCYASTYRQDQQCKLWGRWNSTREVNGSLSNLLPVPCVAAEGRCVPGLDKCCDDLYCKDMYGGHFCCLQPGSSIECM